MTSSLPLPSFEGDVQEGTPSSIDVSIELHNCVMLLSKRNKTLIAPITSISLGSETVDRLDPNVQGQEYIWTVITDDEPTPQI
jgi:hypothetical protein